jgi:transcription antitermination factor NusG
VKNELRRPRFAVGDRVQIIRPGPNSSLVGVVREVDTSKLVVHYVVDFNGIHRDRVPDFDLALIRQGPKS